MRYPHLTAHHELARSRHCPGAGRRIAEARGAGVSLAAMELSFNLIRAANRLQRDLEINVYRPAGMTLAAFRLLVTIRKEGSAD